MAKSKKYRNTRDEYHDEEVYDEKLSKKRKDIDRKKERNLSNVLRSKDLSRLIDDDE